MANKNLNETPVVTEIPESAIIAVAEGALMKNITLQNFMTPTRGQINRKISRDQLGIPNGVATLGPDGKVPASQINISPLRYKGTWDASENEPELQDGEGSAGDYYIVSVGGSQNLGSGTIAFNKGDQVVYDGSIWDIVTVSVDDYIDMEQFGAKGDNSTFNDGAFAQALAYSRSTGIKKIRFGNGLYRFANTIEFAVQDRSIVIEGVGKGRRTMGDVQMGTCIYFIPDTDDVMFMIGPEDEEPEGAPLYNGVQGVTFRDLCILTDGTSNIATWPAAKYRPGSIAIEDNRGGEIHIENVMVQGFDKGLRLINSDFTRSTNYTAYYCNIGMYLGPRSDQNTHIGCDLTFCNQALVIAGASGASFISPNIVMCGTTTAAAVEIKQGDSNNNVNGVSFVSPWFEVDAGTLVANAGNIDLFGFMDIGSELTGNGFVDGLSIISPSGGHSYNAAFGNVNRFARVQKARSISIVACRNMSFKTTGLDLQGAFSPEITVGGYSLTSTRSGDNLGVVTTTSNVNTYRTMTGKQKFLNVSGITSPVIPYNTLDARHGTIYESGNNDTGLTVFSPNSARIYFGAPAASNTAGLAKYLGYFHDTNNSVRIESNGKQVVFELQGLYLGNATRDTNAPGAIGSLMAFPEINQAPTSAPAAGGVIFFRSGKFVWMGTDGTEKTPLTNGGDTTGANVLIGANDNQSVIIRQNGATHSTFGAGYFATPVIINPASGNNARLDLQAGGFLFARAVVDSNTCARFNKPTGSTGKIVDFMINNSSVASVLNSGTMNLTVAEYADNAAALAGGLAVGTVYRTGDNLKIVH